MAILLVLYGISLAAPKYVIFKVFFAVLVLTPLNAHAGEGICSRILNSTSPFAIIKRSNEFFLSEAAKTTAEDRDAVIERLKYFYDTEATKRNLRILRELQAGRGQIVSLTGTAEINDFLNTVKDPSPTVRSPFRTYPIIFVAFIGATELLLTKVPEYRNAIRSIGLIVLIAYSTWLINRAHQNDSNIKETVSIQLIRRQLFSASNGRVIEYVHISRSFSFDHVDVYFTPDIDDPVLDIIHWKGIPPFP